MIPDFLTISQRIEESADVVTIELPTSANAERFIPGQFNMLYAFGVGEIAVSISGDAEQTDTLVHTIRAVGAISRALVNSEPGEHIGVRGPFGVPWPIHEARGKDVLVIAGGIGLAPLRPVIYHLLHHREEFGRVAVLYGARAPSDRIYIDELDRWQHEGDIQLGVTVDQADRQWRGSVGFTTSLLADVDFDPDNTLAMICGPEVMIRVTASALQDTGVASNAIYTSMERNMKCALGTCGHCQFGPHFICKDGPVFRMDQIRQLMSIREI